MKVIKHSGDIVDFDPGSESLAKSGVIWWLRISCIKSVKKSTTNSTKKFINRFRFVKKKKPIRMRRDII
jgi:hypothetical protein